ncbi:MAG: DUF1080 domain-containing protein [Verrucomicrobia bacterium]|nr:DUF1080 domain-containing protein [Verrucomicrobiota bacterium]
MSHSNALLCLIPLCCLGLAPRPAAGAPTAPAPSGDWIPLFDGRTLDGWQAAEHPGSFRVVDGQIACDGPRAHLFYTGPVGRADFKNFEFSAEVLTKPGANSGIYFHTAAQARGFPVRGLEVQVCNTCGGGGSGELKRTGSLYGVRNQYRSVVSDGQWFTVRLDVRGKRVRVWVNGVMTVDWIEPEPPLTEPGRDRRLSRGTLALQCHDPGSRVYYRNLRIRLLPESLPAAEDAAPEVDEAYRHVAALSRRNFPLVDFHAHLKGGLTVEELLDHSRRTGIGYGVAPNCGVGFAITNDAGIGRFLDEMRGRPVFLGMQAEGREWVRLFSPAAVARFDYVFTDAMTFTDSRGRRTRLWIRDEVDVGDPQAFMDRLVETTVGILDHEPVDIYVNPTFLPDAIAGNYDTLWTEPRMRRVIAAAVRNDVAIEINARFRLPSLAFIKLAKQMGARFSLGTNNGGRDLGRLEYSLRMVREAGITGKDMFLPKPPGRKPIEVRGFQQP